MRESKTKLLASRSKCRSSRIKIGRRSSRSDTKSRRSQLRPCKTSNIRSTCSCERVTSHKRWNPHQCRRPQSFHCKRPLGRTFSSLDCSKWARSRRLSRHSTSLIASLKTSQIWLKRREQARCSTRSPSSSKRTKRKASMRAARMRAILLRQRSPAWKWIISPVLVSSQKTMKLLNLRWWIMKTINGKTRSNFSWSVLHKPTYLRLAQTAQKIISQGKSSLAWASSPNSARSLPTSGLQPCLRSK